jgi:hypothetical protein
MRVEHSLAWRTCLTMHAVRLEKGKKERVTTVVLRTRALLTITNPFASSSMALSKNRRAVLRHVEQSSRSFTLTKVSVGGSFVVHNGRPLSFLGAILDIQFSTFYFPPPDGYDRILLEKSLI